MKQEIKDTLNQLLDETKVAVDRREQLATAIAESALRLAASVGKKGYEQAIIRERDVLALEAGIQAANAGDAADALARAKLIGGITGILGIASKALAGGAL